MSNQQSQLTSALVIKRHNYKETDRVVTLITPDQGKITVLAKGARKLNSSKRGILEPGNLIKAFFVQTKTWTLLTQAQLIQDSSYPATLDTIRNIQLVLELFDRVIVEEELEPAIYRQLLLIRQHVIEQTNRGQIRQLLGELLATLGYPTLAQSDHQSITDYVAEITDKPLRSWEYLLV